jgi:hypothetical protein
MYSPQAMTPAFAGYTSHRRVRAAPITIVWGDGLVGVGLRQYAVTYDPKGKPTPHLGWYVIAYEDGYISFCPPEQFANGYVKNKAEPAVSLEEAKAIVETKVAPRVTVESIKAKISRADYYRHEHLTICVLTMANGFFVVGKAAPASAANFDAAVGERYAYEDAFRQIWHFEGYALREELANQD